MGRLAVALVLAAALTLAGWATACEVSPAGLQHIVRWEVGGKALYERKYQRPVCPACLSTASGVTIGVGYDLGHQPEWAVKQHWAAHPQKDRLPPAVGLGGQRAIAMTRTMQDVVTPWAMAEPVFVQTSVRDYCVRTARAYGHGFYFLPQGAKDALVATSYNRGTAMQGDRRRELRTIRDVCVPAKDAECIATNLIASTRLWEGTPVYNGLRSRYLDAARLARTP